MKKITVQVESTPSRYKLDAMEKADVFSREIANIKVKKIPLKNGKNLYTVIFILK